MSKFSLPKDVKVVKTGEETYKNKLGVEINMSTYQIYSIDPKHKGKLMKGMIYRPVSKPNRVQGYTFSRKINTKGKKSGPNKPSMVLGITENMVSSKDGLVPPSITGISNISKDMDIIIQQLLKQIRSEYPKGCTFEIQHLLEHPNKYGTKIKNTSLPKKAYINFYNSTPFKDVAKTGNLLETGAEVSKFSGDLEIIPILKVNTLKMYSPQVGALEDTDDKVVTVSLKYYMHSGIITNKIPISLSEGVSDYEDLL